MGLFTKNNSYRKDTPPKKKLPNKETTCKRCRTRNLESCKCSHRYAKGSREWRVDPKSKETARFRMVTNFQTDPNLRGILSNTHFSPTNIQVPCFSIPQLLRFPFLPSTGDLRSLARIKSNSNPHPAQASSYILLRPKDKDYRGSLLHFSGRLASPGQRPKGREEAT